MGEKGGKVGTVLSVDMEANNIEFCSKGVFTAMGRVCLFLLFPLLLSYKYFYLKEFSIMGHIMPANPEDRKFIADFIQNELNPLLEQNSLKGNAIKVLPNGLHGISYGLEYIQAGKVFFNIYFFFCSFYFYFFYFLVSCFIFFFFFFNMRFIIGKRREAG